MQYKCLDGVGAHRHGGFSLLELSIVMLIIGIMVASILPAITQKELIEKQEELRYKMDVIEDSLGAFRTKYNRLPCPAQPDLDTEDANFTAEAENPGACVGGTPAAVTADTDVVVGALPAEALGLDGDFVYDPWGRAFTYMVDARITADSAYRTYEVDNTSIGNITVKARDQGTATLSNITDKAIAVVISHGPNGHGAYLPSGARYNAGSTSSDEQENCNCDSSAAAGTANATFIDALHTR